MSCFFISQVADSESQGSFMHLKSHAWTAEGSHWLACELVMRRPLPCAHGRQAVYPAPTSLPQNNRLCRGLGKHLLRVAVTFTGGGTFTCRMTVAEKAPNWPDGLEVQRRLFTWRESYQEGRVEPEVHFTISCVACWECRRLCVWQVLDAPSLPQLWPSGTFCNSDTC